MIVQGWPLYLFSFFIAITANWIRFKGKEKHNKVILVSAAFALLIIALFLLNNFHIKQLALLFIGIATTAFHLPGGIAGAGAAWAILSLSEEGGMLLLLHYLLFAAVAHAIGVLIRRTRSERRNMLSMLVDNSKQLNVFKEVSFAMQQTFHIEKLLQTILTSVTAGHGLGFNRAMILLNDEDETKLKGVMGTGPMTAEEGYSAWEEIARKRYELKELIDIKKEENATDEVLNERVRRLEISIDQKNFYLRH